MSLKRSFQFCKAMGRMVPTVAIDGRYVALGNEQPEILVNADKLIKKVRAERAKAAPAPKAK